MNSLELIDIFIADYKQLTGDKLFTTDYVDECLQTLQQIKIKLEAWESIEQYIDIINDKQLWFKMIWFPTKEEKEQYANAIKNVKKALEIKDNE